MRKLILIVCFVTSAFLLFSCNRDRASDEPPHVHSYSTELSYNENVHYYKCMGIGCGEIKDEESHVFGDFSSDGPSEHSGSCICGYKASYPHSWNDGNVTIEPTVDSVGQKTYMCIDCGATYTEEIEKLPNADADDAEDTPEVDDDPTDNPSDEEDDGDNEENIPEENTHEHTFGDWLKNESHHWKRCKSAECNEEADKAEHAWGEGVLTRNPTKQQNGIITYTCTVCDAKKEEEKEYEVKTRVTDAEWQNAIKRDNYTATVNAVVFGVNETSIIKRDGNMLSERKVSGDFNAVNYRIIIDGICYGILPNGKMIPMNIGAENVGQLITFDIGDYSGYTYSGESKCYKSTRTDNPDKPDSCSIFFEDGYIAKVVFASKNYTISIEYTDYGATEIADFPEYELTE